MNLDSYVSNFSNWENQYEEIQEINKQNEEDEIHNKFIEKYPDINFDNLVNLRLFNSSIFTNDGCKHYVDRTTGIVYSYDFVFDKSWKQMENEYQKQLLKIYRYTK